MIVMGIDPGPATSGWISYDTTTRELRACESAASLDEVMFHIGYEAPALIAIERVQSYGIAGGSLLRTSEVVGRLWQCSLGTAPVRLVYRREVLAALNVTGKGNRDTLVRHRLIEQFGGTAKAAKGTKAAPGPLHGISGHAWQALAVAIAAASGAGEVVG